jgi:hypothetical protein
LRSEVCRSGDEMTQQQPNLRRTQRIVQRYKGIVAGFLILGAVAGIAYAYLNPPLESSSTIVILPTPKPNIATDQLIAESEPVLAKALPGIGGGTTLQELRTKITVTSPTANALTITATDKSASVAEADANAVAAAYLAFIGSSSSPVGAVSGRVFEPATTATSGSAITTYVIYGPIGLVVGGIVGFVVALRRDRGDRRLRTRDELASSIGVPVLASVDAEEPGSAHGWLKLFAEYEPDPVQAWALRTTLARLRATGSGSGSGADGDSRAKVAVVSLTTDPGALAIGPQLAVFASSLGIRTVLVVLAQSPGESVAGLRAACAAWRPASAKQADSLRVVEATDADLDSLPEAPLTVVVTTVDDSAALVSSAVRRHATVLAVSPRTVTALQLARAAAAAADAGASVAGIVVANPDPDDTTTGMAPAVSRRTSALPTRVTTPSPSRGNNVATMREEHR